jgi:hypothetical protein
VWTFCNVPADPGFLPHTTAPGWAYEFTPVNPFGDPQPTLGIRWWGPELVRGEEASFFFGTLGESPEYCNSWIYDTGTAEYFLETAEVAMEIIPEPLTALGVLLGLAATAARARRRSGIVRGH